MTADVLKEGGYVIVATGTNAGSADSRGYVVTGTTNVAATIAASDGKAVLGNIDGTVPRQSGHIVLANPAIVSANASYVVFANEPGAVLQGHGYVVIRPFYPPFEDLDLQYSFVEERFPTCVSFGSRGGPGFKTSVFAFDSGITATEVEWERLRARYEATFDNATPEDVIEVEDFFYGMRGAAVGFRYKDWSDYQIANQNVAVGDGESTVFQIFKRYTSGGSIFDRIIKKPVNGSVTLSMDGSPILEGSDYFINYAQGQIVFTTAPTAGAIVKIDQMEFDVPVRFDTDYLEITYSDFQQLNMSVPLIEVLV